MDVAIKGFRDKETRKLFERKTTKAVPTDLQKRALMKVNQLHYADSLEDLKVPPGNKLEKLSGDRGQYSIRINQQYRVCFVWEDGDAYDVEAVDYHKG